MSRFCTILSATVLGAAAAGAQAGVTVGGRTFADNAFADAVALPAVSFLFWDGVTAVPETGTDAAKAGAAMLDTPLGNPALASSTFGACAIGQTEAQCGTIRFSFTDNRIVNGAGADFTVFDINNPSNVKATINGVTLVRATVVAGTTPKPPGIAGSDPWVLNAADFDLSDFGLAAGARVDAVDFHWGLGETTQVRTGFALVGAVNSVPEPASVLLFAAGLAAVAAGAARRTRR